MTNVKKYEYVSKKTATVTPKMPSNYFMENVTFVINYSKPLEKKKSKGSIALYEYDEGQLLDFHLDCIYKVCKNPQIILITGIGSSKLCRHQRRSEFTIVENKFYSHYNNLEDMRLGINAAFFNSIIWLDGRLVPNIKTYKAIVGNFKISTCLTEVLENSNIGVSHNDYGVISEYLYSSNLKIKGLFYFSESDVLKLKYKMAHTFPKNYFDYEALKSDIDIISIRDTSKAILLPDNWTF